MSTAVRLAGIAAAAASAAGLLVAAAPVAQATPDVQQKRANCNWNPATNGDGYMYTTKEIRLRTGPAASCSWIGWFDMPVGQKLWAWCYTVNGSGNTWYYVRPDESGWDPGWIYSGNVDVVGSSIPRCS
ncbi:hypothetical protein [Thermomonospora cellulosilytica]|uniref:SH3 domain-containing protein n=1 Tax=Thermomonospora cellulosilytica TaxID=1411118 RepID=A0A7W3N1D5_9ACTN|nr:hypothetical protein [Thermomonospora cellulosilytica]MBA9005738.1 hypothetical protein [Thermomonospora cellulosilytica]